MRPRLSVGTLAIALALLPARSAPGQEALLPIAGGTFTMAVSSPDTLEALGARVGVDARTLARLNGLAPGATLEDGSRLHVTNRHVLPLRIDEGIVINIPQRMLFYLREGTLEAAYPVAVGRRDWPTPVGGFTVVAKDENPTWIVPESIQQEMRRTGQPVLTLVPPGPGNPLGVHRLRTSMPGIAIHGTIVPESIYGFRSHGCIRMHPDDVADLFARVAVGTRGWILYQPVLLTMTRDGTILLEVHPDLYRRSPPAARLVARFAAALEIADLLDPERVRSELASPHGIAVDVTRRPGQSPSGR